MKKIILLIIFLLAVLGFSFLSLKEVRAAGQLMLDPAAATKNVGDLFSIKIKFQTGGQAISGISARITYSHIGSTPEVQVVNSSGNPVTNNPVVRNPGLDSNWSFPVNSVTATGGIVTLDLSAIYVSIAGYTNNSFEELGTIYLKVNSVPAQNPKILHFDLSQTKMLLKSDSSNILTRPVDGSYTVAGGSICPGGSLGNINCDAGGLINETDLSILLGSWASSGLTPTPQSGRHPADLNGDGKVDEIDLSRLLSNWRTS